MLLVGLATTFRQQQWKTELFRHPFLSLEASDVEEEAILATFSFPGEPTGDWRVLFIDPGGSEVSAGVAEEGS